MLRRWLLRGILLGLILLCLAAWVDSCWNYSAIEYGSSSGGSAAGTVSGSVWLHWYYRAYSLSPGWNFVFSPIDPPSALNFWQYDPGTVFICCGLGGAWTADQRVLLVPYWLLILGLGALLVLVWRKTRPIRAGFPVETSEVGKPGAA